MDCTAPGGTRAPGTTPKISCGKMSCSDSQNCHPNIRKLTDASKLGHGTGAFANRPSGITKNSRGQGYAVSQAEQSCRPLHGISLASRPSVVSAQLQRWIHADDTNLHSSTTTSSSTSTTSWRDGCHDLPQRRRTNWAKPERKHPDTQQRQFLHFRQAVRHPGRWQRRWSAPLYWRPNHFWQGNAQCLVRSY